jgi:hypothetical protein
VIRVPFEKNRIAIHRFTFHICRMLPALPQL